MFLAKYITNVKAWALAIKQHKTNFILCLFLVYSYLICALSYGFRSFQENGSDVLKRKR